MHSITTLSYHFSFLFCLFLLPDISFAQTKTEATLELMDIFDMEYISDPQIAPDGAHIVYARNFKDVMTDGNRSNLWIVKFDGTDNHPLTTGNQRDYAPRWSPDGKKLVYLSNQDGKVQVYLRWMANGAEAKLSNFTESPSNITWSPDGKWIAFTMAVPEKTESLVQLPAKPKGAKWIDPPKYITKMKFKSDGAGFLRNTYRQIFVLSVDGGHPRQLTSAAFNHNGTISWTSDSKHLLFSANHHEERDYEPNNSEIHQLEIETGKLTTLTSRKGPDSNPMVSPDGNWIAYMGFDEAYLGYQPQQLYIMDGKGQNSRCLTSDFDRAVSSIKWSADSKGLYFQYHNEGNTRLAYTDLNGKRSDLTENVGGLSLGRPYSGGQFSISKNDRFAFTHSTPDHPADLAVGEKGSSKISRLTNVNDDLFQYKQLGEVEEIWYTSSVDNRKIQGWICKPPNFNPSKKYPLILEIHGGPFSNYGWRFSSEVQLYAAAGYVVLYTNPRGSTSYGKEFGNLIHHNYPNEDYFDLMSGVDALIEKGYIDTDNLFVTGGSGGGVLTAWIVGNTDRFRAAVVAKPVINWYSFVLHADNPAFFYRYWFPGLPWDHTEHYMKRSPISLVGNVKTPTMLLTGEQDYRTPMSETEQYYTALKLNKVETALVRIQGSGHGIANRPSNLIAKVAYILGWFEKYKKS